MTNDQNLIETVREALESTAGQVAATWTMEDTGYAPYQVMHLVKQGFVIIGEPVAEFEHQGDAEMLLKAPTLLSILADTLEAGKLDEDARGLLDEVNFILRTSSVSMDDEKKWEAEGPDDEVRYLTITNRGAKMVACDELYGETEDVEFIVNIPVWLRELSERVQALPSV